MLLPILASTAMAGGFVAVETRFPDPSLAVVTVSGLRFLVDSGCPRTLVRSDKIGRDGTLALPGSELRLRPLRRSVAELDRPARFLGADGILGNDALGRLAVLIDYRSRRVFMREADGARLEDALRSAGRRGSAVTTEIPITPDGEGWYRTPVVPGNDESGAVWDTGASSYAFAGSRTELGPRLGFVDVQGFERDMRQPIHLTRLDLPDTDPIPILGFRIPKGDEPATIGPYTLTEDWSYLDQSHGFAAVPRPTPEEAARRALASLLRVRVLPNRMDEVTDDALQALARIGDDGGLDRARRSALRLVQSRD